MNHRNPLRHSRATEQRGSLRPVAPSLAKLLLLLLLVCPTTMAEKPGGHLRLSSEEKQSEDSVALWGWPRDAFTMQPVIDSTRVELLTLDSTVIATTRPFWDNYRPNSHFIIPIGFRSGEYIVRLTHPLYQTTTKQFKLKVRKNETSYSIGEIKMRRKTVSRTKQLGEATVTATKIKFYTKGDTLVYNADAFNLAEGSMLDALVEQLPGVELKRDGRILMNGKLVESVLLNGKDFFKGDNTVLLDNLPAYTVKHIKFYDKTGERSEALGMDLNDSRFVMDVNLKREYQIGLLGNAEVGAGTHDRLLGRLFALRFTPQSRLTFYANANNTHESRKPGRNGEWSPSTIGNGTSTTETGGFDYLVNDKNHRYEMEGNLNVIHTDNDAVTKQHRETFQSGGSVFSQSRQTSGAQSTSVTTNHNIRLMLGPENDKYATQLYLKPEFSYPKSKNDADRLSAEFSANPIGQGDLKNLFNGPSAGSALTGIVINKVRSRGRSHSENLSGGFSSQLFFHMPFTGRRMELTTKIRAGRQRAHSLDLYSLTYAATGNEDRRNRNYDNPSDNVEASIGMSWGYLLFRKGFHAITLRPSIGYGYAHTQKDNNLYRLDWLEEMAHADFGALPSTREALLSSLDRPNSYLSTHSSHTASATASFSYSYDQRKRRDNNEVRTALWRLNFTPGVEWKAEELDFNGQQRACPTRSQLLPTMMLRLERNTQGMMHQIWLEGSYRQQQPPLFSLLGLRFDNDPLHISVGNTRLRRTAVYDAELYYSSDRWGQERQQRLSGKLNATFYRNAIATAQLYDAVTGVRTYRPQNVNGNYSLNFSGNFTTPIDARRHFTLNLGLENNFYRNTDLQATDAPVPQRSTVRTNYLSLPLSLEYSYKKVKMGTKFRMAWHSARSRREHFQNVSGVNLDAGIYGNVRLPWNWQLATDFNYYAHHGFAHAVMNTDHFVWNAQLSKSVLKGRLVLALVGYDILGDISNLSYTVNAQGVTETWRNVIPRYAMLRAIFKLNKQPKKKH